MDVLGCPIDPLDMKATVARCLELIERADGCSFQVSVNAAKVVEASRNPRMAEFIRGCELVNADGQAVVWAARLLGRPLPGRVAGIDLMHALLAQAADRGLRVYFLGAHQEVLETALDRIRRTYPALAVAGARNGYFSESQEPDVVVAIRDSGADVLFVAISSPRKEQLLDRYRSELGVGYAMGVGGALDVVAGRARRAPAWMQRLGLEWLYRMAQEPRRMWRRYAVGNGRFSWLLIKGLAARRSG